MNMNWDLDKLYTSLDSKEYKKDKEELKGLIEKLIKERGNEADLNDIDVSQITDMDDLFANF